MGSASRQRTTQGPPRRAGELRAEQCLKRGAESGVIAYIIISFPALAFLAFPRTNQPPPHQPKIEPVTRGILLSKWPRPVSLAIFLYFDPPYLLPVHARAYTHAPVDLNLYHPLM